MNTVTIDLEGYNGYTTSSGDYITITSTPTIDTIDITQYEFDFGEEWVDHFPDFNEVDRMRKEYPALEKAFENFRTIYKMVKDDYASKTRDDDQ